MNSHPHYLVREVNHRLADLSVGAAIKVHEMTSISDGYGVLYDAAERGNHANLYLVDAANKRRFLATNKGEGLP